MKSCGFDGFHLSDLEKGVRSHHDQIRRRAAGHDARRRARQKTDIAALNERCCDAMHGTAA